MKDDNFSTQFQIWATMERCVISSQKARRMVRNMEIRTLQYGDGDVESPYAVAERKGFNRRLSSSLIMDSSADAPPIIELFSLARRRR